MFIAFYRQHALLKKHHVGMKYLFIKSFIKLHTIGFTRDIFITCQSPRKSLLCFSPPPSPLPTVYKRIRLSVRIAISLILSRAVACTQGAASLTPTGQLYLKQFSLPCTTQNGLLRVLQTILLLYSVPATGMARPLIYGGRHHAWAAMHRKKSGHTVHPSKGNTFISVSVCPSYQTSLRW